MYRSIFSSFALIRPRSPSFALFVTVQADSKSKKPGEADAALTYTIISGTLFGNDSCAFEDVQAGQWHTDAIA
jgi:hypothetical protein